MTAGNTMTTIKICALCDKQVVAHNLCGKHYQQHNKGTLVESSLIGYEYVCVSNKSHSSIGWCQHKGGKIGRPRNEVVGYQAAHKRMRSELGNASTYGCVEGWGSNAHPAEDWSLEGEPTHKEFITEKNRWYAYSLDSEAYVPRCKSCHRTVDARRSVSMEALTIYERASVGDAA